MWRPFGLRSPTTWLPTSPHCWVQAPQLLEGRLPPPLLPSDIAVLVRKNERGEAIRDQLVAAGVPAVMYGASSVFASPMARDWLTLLLALEQTRQQSVRQAA